MKENRGNIKITLFFAYSIIILIGLYLMASVFVSFIPVSHQTFTIIFTLSGGIPALILLFNEKYLDHKTTNIKTNIRD